MKRYVTHLFAAAGLAAVLAASACGGESGQSAAGSTQATSTPTPTGTGQESPLIVVEHPSRSETVSSPVEISGTANVFEANVTVRILDSQGAELAHDFTTATCGTGCRGTFSIRLPYRSPTAQNGTIVVSDDDADGNGHPQHVVTLPVRLAQS
jgi:hypothetical protein